MTAWGLAWRTIAHSPARSVLAVVGVTVIGALLFDMLLLSRGLLVSFHDLLEAQDFDLRVVAAEGSMVHRPPIADATSLVEAIARLPEVQRVTLVRSESAEAILPGRDRRGIRITLVGTTAAAAGSVWTMTSGASLPSVTDAGAPPPLVISTGLASELQLAPGSELQLRLFRPGAASDDGGVFHGGGHAGKQRRGPGAGLVAKRGRRGRGRRDFTPPPGCADPL